MSTFSFNVDVLSVKVMDRLRCGLCTSFSARVLSIILVDRLYYDLYTLVSANMLSIKDVDRFYCTCRTLCKTKVNVLFVKAMDGLCRVRHTLSVACLMPEPTEASVGPAVPW